MRGMNQALEDRFQFERFALKMEQTQARLDDSPRHLGTSVITAFDFESHDAAPVFDTTRATITLHPTDRLTRLVRNGIAFAFKLDSSTPPCALPWACCEIDSSVPSATSFPRSMTSSRSQVWLISGQDVARQQHRMLTAESLDKLAHFDDLEPDRVRSSVHPGSAAMACGPATEPGRRAADNRATASKCCPQPHRSDCKSTAHHQRSALGFAADAF